MFKLMDRVPHGIAPMLRDLEDHIVNAGLAEMIAAADIITQVRQNINSQMCSWFLNGFFFIFV
jgi:cullin-5